MSSRASRRRTSIASNRSGWARDNRTAFVGELFGAVGARVAQHIQTKGAANIAPEIMEAMGLGKKGA